MKIKLAIAVIALSMFTGIGYAQSDLSLSPVECVLDTTQVTSPALIPTVELTAQRGSEAPIVVMTLTDVPIGELIDVDIPLGLGAWSILPIALDQFGELSVPPVPWSTVSVTVVEPDPVVGSCGLRRR